MRAATSSSPSLNVSNLLLRLLGLAVIDAFAVWFITNLIADGVYYLAIAVAIVTLFLNIVFLREGLYPLRWMAVGLSLMALLAIYPILFTVYVAFTNFGDGHILTKQQAIEQLEKELYLPEGGASFSWTAFRAADGSFALWLLPGEGDGPGLLARPEEPVEAVAPGEAGVGPLDEDGIPESIEGYERLRRGQTVALITQLSNLEFGEPPDTIKIRSLDAAAELQSRYVYDEARDAIINQETGVVYTAVDGTFTSPEGEQLRPGFSVPIGFRNFQRFFGSAALRGPLLTIIIWNFTFAILSVVTTFALGLFIALIFNDLPGKKIIRTLLLIPYTIPSLITILVWRGMLNPDLGIISTTLKSVIGSAPAWYANPTWAKIGILLINLWLGYPYFMLICSGALQSIPQDIYSAAEVDGANNWQQFWRLTLPLLLVAVGPLLIASFTFNFNNFNVIYLYNSGGPPIPNTTTPAGYTDILVSYVYRLAFAGGRGADYGLASAITIIIFFIVATITLFQFRYTRMWEEVGESV
jgi:arabinogalactan oligomer / maltooligosaccharide transport system permease protein